MRYFCFRFAAFTEAIGKITFLLIQAVESHAPPLALHLTDSNAQRISYQVQNRSDPALPKRWIHPITQSGTTPCPKHDIPLAERILLHQGSKSHAFTKLPQQRNVKQSFSATVRPHDNSVAEAFFASFKKEAAYRREYASEQSCRKSVEQYIPFHNKTLKYKTPSAFEEAYQAGLWKSHVQIASLHKNFAAHFKSFELNTRKSHKEKALTSQGNNARRSPFLDKMFEKRTSFTFCTLPTACKLLTRHHGSQAECCRLGCNLQSQNKDSRCRHKPVPLQHRAPSRRR